MNRSFPFLLLTTIGALGCAEDNGKQGDPLAPIPITCAATPEYASVPPEVDLAPAPRVDVYVDTSYSIAGFLPPSSSSGRSTLRALADEAAAQLQGSTGFQGTVVQPATFGEGISLGWPKDFGPASFKGKRSDLNGVFEQVKSDLGSGNAHSAAVITDLVATGDTKGGIQAAQSLVEWARTATATGSVTVGMLGITARYWGVRDASCRGAAKGAGCWFSEQTGAWQPLTAVVEVPLYVLIFGRSIEQVEHVGKGIQAVVAPSGSRSQWELLVHKEHPRELPMRCEFKNPDPGRPPHFSGARRADGALQCPGSEPFTLDCRGSADSSVSLEGAKSTWPSAGVVAGDNGFEVTIDCGATKAARPAAALQVEAQATFAALPSPWSDWTAASDVTEDALGRTLRLAEFTDLVRSGAPKYSMSCGPIFGASQP